MKKPANYVYIDGFYVNPDAVAYLRKTPPSHGKDCTDIHFKGSENMFIPVQHPIEETRKILEDGNDKR